MGISIQNPIMLLLIIPVAGLIIISARFLIKRQVRYLKWTLTAHILIGVFLILALSGVSILIKRSQTNTVFVVDVSDSTKNQSAVVENFVASAIQEMPQDTYAGIITFGKNARIEQFLSDKKVFSGFKTTPVTTSTNMEGALNVAATMLDDSYNQRIVLITDGKQNEGEILSLSQIYANKGIEFKIFQIEVDETPEVYIDSMSIPEEISVGDVFSIDITIDSNISTEATLYLYQGRTLKNTTSIQLETGENNFVFSDTLSDAGLAGYRAVIDAPGDTQSINNEYYAYAQATVPPRILIIESSLGDAGQFLPVLEAANISYDCVTPSGVPRSMDQLLEYKSVITVDVHSDDLTKDFMELLKTYVQDYGGGYIATGGENSFALGGYKNTPLETILPVSMDLTGEKEIPQMSMVMVIDHSTSMGDGNGYASNLDLAKAAAASALENLRDTDKVGILGFSDEFSWNSPLSLISDRQAVEDAIFSIPLAGGTSIYPALKEAVDAMEKDDSAIRHIILLTDGQDGYKNYEDLLERINRAGISLSTVSVGQSADRGLLKSLADSGNGRYYHTDVSESLPRIFAKEVFLSAKAYLVNRDFVPAISSNSEIITSVAGQGLPVLHGYVAATPKELADVLLSSDSGDPILAVWQHGLGKTAAFTSDVKNLWTGEYALWENYPALWKNVIEATLSQESQGQASASASLENGEALVTYHTKQFSSSTKVRAVCTSQDGEKQELELRASSPGIFTASLQKDLAPGIYSINVRQSEGEDILYSVNTALANPYSSEYRFGQDDGSFLQFAQNVGAVKITEPSQVFDTKLSGVRAMKDLTLPFLFAAWLFFVADIAGRRLSIYNKLSGAHAAKLGKSLLLAGNLSNGSLKTTVVRKNIRKIRKKDIEKTHKRGYNKKESALDTTSLLKKKKEREKDF